jgi:hypothetical protein
VVAVLAYRPKYLRSRAEPVYGMCARMRIYRQAGQYMWSGPLMVQSNDNGGPGSESKTASLMLHR